MTTFPHIEHTGSLLRPAAVTEAFLTYNGSGVSDIDRSVAFATICEQSKSAIERQLSLGFTAPTDGEYSRSDWFTDFHERLLGLENIGPVTFPFTNVNDGQSRTFSMDGLVATEATLLGDVIFEQEARLLSSYNSDTVIPKLTIPSPSLITTTPESQTDEVREAVIAAYVTQIQALADLGLRYVQIDDPWLIVAQHIGQEETGNYCLSQMAELISRLPGEVQVGVHICRGNYQSGYIASGGYDKIAPFLFNELGADRLFLEFDDERSGDLEILGYHDGGDTDVVLGLVSSKRAALENRDFLLRQLETAATHIPAGQLAISPQCGFASDSSGNELSESQQWDKLGLLSQIGDEFWTTS